LICNYAAATRSSTQSSLVIGILIRQEHRIVYDSAPLTSCRQRIDTRTRFYILHPVDAQKKGSALSGSSFLALSR
jgi:hypothetical protein